MRRRLVLPLVLVSTAAVIWALFPAPFVRGAVVGCIVTFTALFGGVVLMSRRMRRKLESRLKPPQLPTTTWDYAMEGKTLDGEVVAFSRFSDKVLVLNFWATWCAPCIAEMPSLARLREKTAGLPVHVACITREDREVVRTFLERRELNTPIYLLRGEAPACFDSRAVPATYIISRGGLIAFRHIGAAAWDAESVVAFVRGLAVAPAL